MLINIGILSIVSRLGHYFEDAAFDIKRKIIGSIFPEKLTFDGEKYRTTEINEVISLLTNDYRALQGIEIKKADGRVGFSSLAP
jgi:site-specific DNA recombinase